MENQKCFDIYVFHYTLKNIVNSSGDANAIVKCVEGNQISFERPRPHSKNVCNFLKLNLIQDEVIERNGVLAGRHSRFELDGERKDMLLNNCEKGDAGTYIWMCGKDKRHFTLEVIAIKSRL